MKDDKYEAYLEDGEYIPVPIYVRYSTASVLKEIGYPQIHANCYYTEDGTPVLKKIGDNLLACPTVDEALQWIRKVLHCVIEVDHVRAKCVCKDHHAKRGCEAFLNWTDEESYVSDYIKGIYPEWEDAAEAGIREVCRKIKDVRAEGTDEEKEALETKISENLDRARRWVIHKLMLYTSHHIRKCREEYLEEIEDGNVNVDCGCND